MHRSTGDHATTRARVLAALTVVLALAAGWLSPSGSAAPASTASAQVRLTLKAPSSVTTGSRATVTGRLGTAGGRAIPRVTITLQTRRPGGNWRAAGHDTTSRTGAWRIATGPIVATTEVRARSSATNRWPRATSPTRTVSVAGTPTPIPTPVPTPTPTPTPSAPSITTSSLPAADEELPYDQQLSASGGTAPLAWSLASGKLPAGLTLGGTGRISGTPTVEGLAAFTVRVVDAANREAVRELEIQVVNASLQILTSTLPDATQGAAYSSTLAARGTEGTLTWSLLPGDELPAGLTLATDGTVSGTPADAGASAFGVQVLDSAGGATSGEVSLSVAPAVQPVFLDASLPVAQLGVGYHYPVRVVGGSGSYAWTITDGGLPTGLTLHPGTGLVRGVASMVGSGTVTLRAQDGSGTATRTLSWQVTAASSWPQDGRDAGGTGFSPGEQTLTAATASRVREEWRIESGNLSRVADGTLFSADFVGGSSSMGIVARDLATGEVLWSRVLPFRSGQSDYCDRLAVSSAHVVCQTSFDVVAVSRTGDHAIAWQTSQTDPGGFYTGLVLAGDRVLTINHGQLTAYGLGAGQVVWSWSGPHQVRGISAGADRVYASDDGGELRTFGLATGAPGWVQDDAVDPYTPPVVVPGRNEVITTGGGPVVWRSAETGQELRRYVSLRGLRGRLAVDGQRVYVPTGRTDELGNAYDCGVTAVRHSDATEVWRWDTTEPVDAGMAVAQDLVWVHTSHPPNVRTPSTLTALATGSGTPVVSRAVPDTTAVGPMAAGGRVVVTSAVTQVLGVMAPAPQVRAQLLPTGWTGRAYAGSLTATGGTSPFSWSVVSGNLPTGLGLSAVGQLTGTPTSTGRTTFRVRVVDATGRTSERDVSVAVRQAGVADWRTMGGGEGRAGVADTEGSIGAVTIGGFGVRFSSVPVPPTAGGQNGSSGEEPLVVGGRVYGVLGAGEVRVWSTAGGTGTSPLATRVLPSGEEFMGTPALQGTTSTGTLYAVTSGSRLVALDAATLDVEWSVDGVGEASDQVAPLVVGGRVLLAVGGDLVAVDTTSRTITWRHALGAGVGPHSASTDGTLAFAYAECDVVAVRVADGTEVWRRSLAWNGSGCNTPEVYWPQFRVAPVVRDGVVYASSHVEGTAALDAASGSTLWRTRALVFAPTPVVTENWVVLTGAFQKALLVLDRDTGEVVRTSTLDDVPDIDSSPTVVGDLAVFRTNGRIQAVDLLTLRPVWTSPSLGTGFTAGAVSVHGGRLYAYTGDGRVVGLGAPG